jgi:iron complex transport system ATP-binding protein
LSLNFDFPGVTASLTPEALVLRSQSPLQTLASAVVGGGVEQTRCLINHHVDKHYHHADPAGDLRNFAQRQGIAEPFVGLMTAVDLQKARAVTLREGELIVSALITAGVKSNPTAAGLSYPAMLKPGTINLILLLAARLTPAAMVNAVITATEAKTHVLLARGLRTPEGFPVTGTSTDSIVIACTGQGDLLPYAGPATQIGWLIGRSVRQGLTEALDINP